MGELRQARQWKGNMEEGLLGAVVLYQQYRTIFYFNNQSSHMSQYQLKLSPGSPTPRHIQHALTALVFSTPASHLLLMSLWQEWLYHPSSCLRQKPG